MDAIIINRYGGYHGILLFLLLVAFAMVQMSPFYVILPLFLLAVAYALPILGSATSYLAIVLTVSKKE